MSRDPERCLSGLELEELVHGELAEADARSVQAHLQSCQLCAGRTAAVRQSDRAAAADSDRFARALAARHPQLAARTASARPALRWSGWQSALAAGLAGLVLATTLTLLYSRRPAAPPGTGEQGEIIIKGTTSLRVFCRRAGAVHLRESGDQAAAGDALRFEVQGGKRSFVLVLSLQADGKVAIYAPFGGQRSLAIERNRRAALPGSVVLDESSQDEVLFALFSSTPLDARRAAAAARTAFAQHGGRLEAIRRLPLAVDQNRHLLRRTGRGEP